MLKNSLKISSQGYPVFLKLVDFIVINVVLIFSAHLLGLVPFNTIAILSLLFSIFFLLFAEYIKMYQQKIKTIGLRNQKRLVFCTLLAFFFNELVSMTVAEPESLGYLDRLPSPFYSAIIYWYFIPLPFLYYIRFFLFKYTARKNIRVAVIGLTENGLAAENALTTEYANIKLDLAFYDERSPSRCGDVVEKIKSPFRGSVSNLVEEARQGNIDEIYIALPMVALHRIRHFLAMMSDTTVDTYIVPDFYTYSNNMSKLRSIHNLQTIGIFSSPFEGAGSFIKRAEDLVLGSIIMVMISSLMLAIAIGIKLTSRGPVFFKQDRYGL
ncbi:TPA: sugar transferase, partial [Citrobacter freundii]|nr:sugar transferase [Citrobacter freundii]HEE9870912.1 sugar transferase [Citrobacter freundii]HEE9890235.1 sugar transferase [Citrobacter freundii]